MKWTRYCSFACVLFCFSLLAAEKEQEAATQQQGVKANKAPSIALLNYLAGMTEVDGKLLGPQDMQDKIIPQCKRDNTNTEQTPEKTNKPNEVKQTMNNDKAAKEECQSNE